MDSNIGTTGSCPFGTGWVPSNFSLYQKSMVSTFTQLKSSICSPSLDMLLLSGKSFGLVVEGRRAHWPCMKVRVYQNWPVGTCRYRPRSYFDNCLANRKSHPSDVGHCWSVPFYRIEQPSIFDHAPRVEHNGSSSIYIFCFLLDRKSTGYFTMA